MGYSYGKVALITGASSGMGKAIAEYMSKNGYKVYGTSRKAQEENNNIEGSNGGFIKMLQLDVREEQSVKTAVEFVKTKEGEINILINCAGFALAGPVEETTAEEAMGEFDTNFFGALRMYRSVVPIMRKQKSGLIINISSVAGFIAVPFQSMYSASKYALEAMVEALRMEVKPFGIKVTMVEPGDIKTGFTDGRLFAAAAKDNSSYGEKFTKSVNSMIKSELGGPGPEVVVKEVAKLLTKKNPPIRVIVGLQYKMVGVLKRILPSTVVESIVSSMY